MPETFRTLQQIVKAHIEAKSRLAFDPPAVLKEAREAEARLQLRLKSDPSLETFVSHYATGLIAAWTIIPDEIRQSMVTNLLAEIVMEWEDCNRLFDGQFQPAPQRP